MAPKTVDITPTPKILRTLGDIPFEIWQSFAELVDNSLDAFKSAKEQGISISEPRIDVLWSSGNIPGDLREVLIEDNGPGMDLETLQKAAKAGYSSNDPVSNLGLFGMGFNIATARMGDETVFVSSRCGDDKWRGIRINFDELISSQEFSAPIIELDKEDINSSGTKIYIRKLKNGIYSDLKAKEKTIRRRLESIYTPILDNKNISFYVQGKKLDSRPHCVWDKSRFSMRKNEKVYAIQEIDKDLGNAYFDNSRNRYLNDDECAEIDILRSKSESIPESISPRARRLKGWIGVQRFADPSDFGIDFIRNGRKILVSNKEIFGYESEDTGAFISEYPVELGSTVGGRIVGEIHADYLIPTYQKNAFDKTDKAWRLTVEAIRGGGPILPKKRQALGYDGDNNSPLGLLVNTFRRVDPGTKNLSAPNALAKEWGKRFFSDHTEYATDEKWYKAAQESDREKGEAGGKVTPVNPGDESSDDIDSYFLEDDLLPVGKKNPDLSPDKQKIIPAQINSSRNDLIADAAKQPSLSGKYSYSTAPGFEVTAWKLTSSHIKINGVRLPAIAFQDGVEIDFFYDATHPILSDYPISPKQILLQLLAEKFSLRDAGTSLQGAFFGLVDNHLQDERVNTTSLQERAGAILTVIREKLPSLLKHNILECLELIHSSPIDEEHLASKLLEESPQLLEAYQKKSPEANKAFEYINDNLVMAFVKNFPTHLLDNQLFNIPYTSISGFAEPTTARLRSQAQEKIVNYLKDVSLFLTASKSNKNELIRMSNTLSILEGLVP